MILAQRQAEAAAAREAQAELPPAAE
jgi:hypothetical protein